MGNVRNIAEDAEQVMKYNLYSLLLSSEATKIWYSDNGMGSQKILLDGTHVGKLWASGADEDHE